MRLDQYLTKHHNIQSRNKASELIKKSKVVVNEKIITKPSFIVLDNFEVKILEDEFFVSRSAYKLKYFLEDLKLELKDCTALDIGSSTGGFTQVLLKNNVKDVTCVDVGSNQLHEIVKQNSNITFYENTDIRKFRPNICFDIVTCDVSFISILNIIESINTLANNKIIILFKPQFEVGANIKRDKKGVVQDKSAIANARENFLEKTKTLNWKLISNAKSKLQGKDGNDEELFYFNK